MMVNRRQLAAAASSVCFVALALVGVCPSASADPGQPVDMNSACGLMYPKTSDFLPATAYQVAPRDAYSWRCQRTSISPNGGVVTDLSADPNVVCPARMSSSSPSQWECTA